MRQHELELGSQTCHCTLDSRCFWRAEEPLLTPLVTVVLWKADFGVSSFVVLFSREAKIEEVPSMSSLSKEICGLLGLGAAVCWKWLLCTVLLQDFPVWGKVSVWLTLPKILNLWGSIAWWQDQYQPVLNCNSLILAVQVTGQWSGENSPARNRCGHRVTNSGSRGRSTSCPYQAHPVVLVTHQGQGEKPRERRCTGGLLR